MIIIPSTHAVHKVQHICQENMNRGGNNLLFGKMFAENCMKVKEIGLALHLIRHS